MINFQAQNYQMLEKIIRDYFSFSKRERVAVMVLVILIIVIAALPYLMPERNKKPGHPEVKTFRLQASQLQDAKKDDKPSGSEIKAYTHLRESSFEHPPFNAGGALKKATLFYFDPNSLSPDGWRKLGLRDKTITTINNYILRGGKFKNKGDIEKIYGLHPDEVERLLPYVRIAPLDITTKHAPQETNYSKDQFVKKRTWSKEMPVSSVIDLNKADSAELVALPGIGPKLTERILHFREKLGGFYTVDQVSEIYGLPDSTFQKIKPLLTISASLNPSININTIDATALKQHPYLKWNMAAAIIEYRRQHGNFQNLEDLRKIEIITAEVYKKIVPYLRLE
jgi:competence protein ComEA